MPVFLDIPEKLFRREKENKALERYFSVIKGKEKPKFRLLGKHILKKKISQATAMLKSCMLCERKCAVNRLKGKKGYCRLGKDMLVSSFFEHHGEEPFFIPSFAVLFWSCNFECQYCQNWRISQRKETPNKVPEEELASIIDEHSSCKNVNFVGGEPTPQLPSILRVIHKMKSDMPVIWNSNFYMSEETMHLLVETVDVYLSDFKYGNNECAERLSKIPDYIEVVTRNHLLANSDSEMVVRHLVLPGHLDCCTKPILKWIAENLGDRVIVNLMDQYKPDYKASLYPEINRYPTKKEFQEAVDYAKKLKLNFIY